MENMEKKEEEDDKQKTHQPKIQCDQNFSKFSFLYATHVENSEIQVPKVKDCGKLRLTYANDHGHLRELVGHVRQFWGKTREKPWKQAERGIRDNERNHVSETMRKSSKDS